MSHITFTISNVPPTMPPAPGWTLDKAYSNPKPYTHKKQNVFLVAEYSKKYSCCQRALRRIAGLLAIIASIASLGLFLLVVRDKPCKLLSENKATWLVLTRNAPPQQQPATTANTVSGTVAPVLGHPSAQQPTNNSNNILLAATNVLTNKDSETAKLLPPINPEQLAALEKTFATLESDPQKLNSFFQKVFSRVNTSNPEEAMAMVLKTIFEDPAIFREFLQAINITEAEINQLGEHSKEIGNVVKAMIADLGQSTFNDPEEIPLVDLFSQPENLQQKLSLLLPFHDDKRKSEILKKIQQVDKQHGLIKCFAAACYPKHLKLKHLDTTKQNRLLATFMTDAELLKLPKGHFGDISDMNVDEARFWQQRFAHLQPVSHSYAYLVDGKKLSDIDVNRLYDEKFGDKTADDFMLLLIDIKAFKRWPENMRMSSTRTMIAGHQQHLHHGHLINYIRACRAGKADPYILKELDDRFLSTTCGWMIDLGKQLFRMVYSKPHTGDQFLDPRKLKMLGPHEIDDVWMMNFVSASEWVLFTDDQIVSTIPMMRLHQKYQTSCLIKLENGRWRDIVDRLNEVDLYWLYFTLEPQSRIDWYESLPEIQKQKVLNCISQKNIVEQYLWIKWHFLNASLPNLETFEDELFLKTVDAFPLLTYTTDTFIDRTNGKMKMWNAENVTDVVHAFKKLRNNPHLFQKLTNKALWKIRQFLMAKDMKHLNKDQIAFLHQNHFKTPAR